MCEEREGPTRIPTYTSHEVNYVHDQVSVVDVCVYGRCDQLDAASLLGCLLIINCNHNEKRMNQTRSYRLGVGRSLTFVETQVKQGVKRSRDDFIVLQVCPCDCRDQIDATDATSSLSI